MKRLIVGAITAGALATTAMAAPTLLVPPEPIEFHNNACVIRPDAIGVVANVKIVAQVSYRCDARAIRKLSISFWMDMKEGVNGRYKTRKRWAVTFTRDPDKYPAVPGQRVTKLYSFRCKPGRDIPREARGKDYYWDIDGIAIVWGNDRDKPGVGGNIDHSQDIHDKPLKCWVGGI